MAQLVESIGTRLAQMQLQMEADQKAFAEEMRNREEIIAKLMAIFEAEEAILCK